MDDRWLSDKRSRCTWAGRKNTVYACVANKALPGIYVFRFWKFKSKGLGRLV
jgi:hypothetical protein